MSSLYQDSEMEVRAQALPRTARLSRRMSGGAVGKWMSRAVNIIKHGGYCA